MNGMLATLDRLRGYFPDRLFLDGTWAVRRSRTLMMDTFFDRLQKMYRSLCDEVGKRQSDHSRELINSIQEYIGINYTDGQLCLSSVAQHFGLSETYLSHLYHKRTGEYFSAFIETTRIKRACSIFETSPEITVKDTAFTVGYGNPQTFRRAFFRVMSVTPASYRAALSVHV